MVGKITAVLAKKEAETYSSQGLHREAINLYSGLLAASPNIDPAIKASIQSHINGLSEKMEASKPPQPDCPLSNEEIVRIKEGWGATATSTDILVCAHAFYQIGSFVDALEEFKHLIKKDGLKKKYVQWAADCLAHLHEPNVWVEKVIHFAEEIAPTLKERVAVQLAMARHVSVGDHIEHAAALFNHLKCYPSLARMVSGYISKLPAVKDTPPSKALEPEKTETGELRRPHERRSRLNRIARLFRRKDGDTTR